MAAGGGIFLFIRTGSPAQPAPATPSSSSVHTFQLASIPSAILPYLPFPKEMQTSQPAPSPGEPG